MNQKYNDKLDADQQITAEEQIAAHIFDNGVDVENGQVESPSEEFCNKLGKEILLMVLAEFRPDLIQAEGAAATEASTDLKAYVESGGAACPFCAESCLEGQAVETGGGSAYQPITCTRCSGSWNDVYKLVAVGEVVVPDLADSDLFKCTMCGGVHDIDDSHKVNGRKGDLVCHACFEKFPKGD